MRFYHTNSLIHYAKGNYYFFNSTKKFSFSFECAMYLKLQFLPCVWQVKFEVKIAAGIRPKDIVIEEANNAKAKWIVMDRSLISHST